MRGARLGGLALGIVLFGVASGCRSLPSPPPPMEGGLVLLPDTLPPEAERAAKVHALYSIGIHHELADEYDRAADAYRQAYELDPDQERLALRLASMLALQRQPEEALRTVEDFRVRQPTSE
ncbi:MAG TPA: tetratricopeptide repeat protein, partial [Kiritimatiellia bacterium]|nr:tetratricopeptide repeat protein [Kiritimatiellia bacterium]